MGRTRKPLSEQRGDLTKARKTRLDAEQELVKAEKKFIEKPPSWLSYKAKKEYKRIYSAMKGMDLIGDLDANNLAAYCNAWDNYLIATAAVNTQGQVIQVGGEKIENPSVALQTKYAKEMREFGKQCGLSIDSRLKFASQKLEAIEDKISETFGDI